MPHHAILVYDVGNPTGEESEAILNPVQLSYLPSLVAEQGEGQSVL